MPGLTPDEQIRVNKVMASLSNPGYPVGDAFSMIVMIQLFMRVVTLRDFAAAQVATNQALAARISDLEQNVKTDNATITSITTVMVADV